MIEALKQRVTRATAELLDDAETVKLLQLLDNRSFEESVKIIDEANRRAVSMRQDHLIGGLNDVRDKLIRTMREADERERTRHPLQMGGG
jgi:replicative DNA helicase